LDKVKVSKAHSIVPEIAHLINSEAADVSFTDFGTHSVAVTTLDSLEKVAAPWRNAANTVQEEEELESQPAAPEPEELPGKHISGVAD
jgi:hypothetical protein